MLLNIQLQQTSVVKYLFCKSGYWVYMKSVAWDYFFSDHTSKHVPVDFSLQSPEHKTRVLFCSLQWTYKIGSFICKKFAFHVCSYTDKSLPQWWFYGPESKCYQERKKELTVHRRLAFGNRGEKHVAWPETLMEEIYWWSQRRVKKLQCLLNSRPNL